MTSWLVTVDYRSRSGEELDIADDRLAECAELLTEHTGEVSTDGHVYSVAVLIEATTPRAAWDAAEDLIGPALERSGLPMWPRVRVEVIEGAEVQRSGVE